MNMPSKTRRQPLIRRTSTPTQLNNITPRPNPIKHRINIRRVRSPVTRVSRHLITHPNRLRLTTSNHARANVNQQGNTHSNNNHNTQIRTRRALLVRRANNSRHNISHPQVLRQRTTSTHRTLKMRQHKLRRISLNNSTPLRRTTNITLHNNSKVNNRRHITSHRNPSHQRLNLRRRQLSPNHSRRILHPPTRRNQSPTNRTTTITSTRHRTQRSEQRRTLNNRTVRRNSNINRIKIHNQRHNHPLTHITVIQVRYSRHMTKNRHMLNRIRTLTLRNTTQATTHTIRSSSRTPKHHQSHMLNTTTISLNRHTRRQHHHPMLNHRPRQTIQRNRLHIPNPQVIRRHNITTPNRRLTNHQEHLNRSITSHTKYSRTTIPTTISNRHRTQQQRNRHNTTSFLPSTRRINRCRLRITRRRRSTSSPNLTISPQTNTRNTLTQRLSNTTNHVSTITPSTSTVTRTVQSRTSKDHQNTRNLITLRHLSHHHQRRPPTTPSTPHHSRLRRTHMLTHHNPHQSISPQVTHNSRPQRAKTQNVINHSRPRQHNSTLNRSLIPNPTTNSLSRTANRIRQYQTMIRDNTKQMLRQSHRRLTYTNIRLRVPINSTLNTHKRNTIIITKRTQNVQRRLTRNSHTLISQHIQGRTQSQVIRHSLPNISRHRRHHNQRPLTNQDSQGAHLQHRTTMITLRRRITITRRRSQNTTRITHNRRLLRTHLSHHRRNQISHHKHHPIPIKGTHTNQRHNHRRRYRSRSAYRTPNKLTNQIRNQFI